MRTPRNKADEAVAEDGTEAVEVAEVSDQEEATEAVEAQAVETEKPQIVNLLRTAKNPAYIASTLVAPGECLYGVNLKDIGIDDIDSLKGFEVVTERQAMEVKAKAEMLEREVSRAPDQPTFVG